MPGSCWLGSIDLITDRGANARRSENTAQHPDQTIRSSGSCQRPTEFLMWRPKRSEPLFQHSRLRRGSAGPAVGAGGMMPCAARRILTDITDLVKAGARGLSPSRTRPQGLALAGSESQTLKVQALRHIRRTASMPWEGGPSLPVSECLSDSPLFSKTD